VLRFTSERRNHAAEREFEGLPLRAHQFQWQVAEVQRALPELIRARAIEVPVFLSRAGNQKRDACLGVFEGLPLLQAPPAQPDEMQRITLFFDILAEAANYRRIVFLREV